MRTFEVGARRTLGNGERFAELRCTTDRHYKAYILTLTRVSEADAGLNAEWMVTAFWGRIGASVQSQVKYHGTDHKEATRAFEEWMRRKIGQHDVRQLPGGLTQGADPRRKIFRRGFTRIAVYSIIIIEG